MNGEKNLYTVGVYTENEYLFQKIKLELSKIAEVFLLGKNDDIECDKYLVDADTPAFSDIDGIKMGRNGPDIELPFRIGALSSLFKRDGGAFIELIDSKKTVKVGEKSVKLTELEYSLLSLLVSHNGGYVSRDEIIDSVWDSRADKGIVNVYIHYLREKLESSGEKVIISTRKLGYKIDEKYFEEAPV